MVNSKCKICRRIGTKLFLKGEKCLSPKCPMVKKAYPPGKKSKRRPTPLSEFGKELREKQKIKNWYNLSEKQFRKYVREILKKRGKVENAAALLIQRLESRFDNVVFRLGFSASHSQARQLITHSHFCINGRPANIPALQLKKGDVISVKPASKKNKVFANLAAVLKKYQPPSWLKINAEKLEGKIISKPTLEEVVPPAEISAIFEYYSR